MTHHRVRLLSLTLLLVTGAPLAHATDEALLRILLENKAITAEQFDQLRQAGSNTPAPGTATAGRKAPAGDENLLDVLLANGLISQQQYAALQVKAADDKVKKQTAGEATVTLADGIKMKTAAGDFQSQVSMYAQLDGAWYDDEGTDFSDGTEVRRARLSMNGTFLTDWEYKLEADFAGLTAGGSTNNVSLTDAYLRYNGFKPVNITAGSFKVPFSLEAVSSGKYMTFMERGLPFAFLNLRALGGQVATNGDNWTAAAGVFGDTVTTQNVDDEGRGVAGRITWAPVFRRDEVLHLGLGAQWRKPGQRYSVNATTGAISRLETLRFRSKPESNLLIDNRIDLGSFTETDGDMYGISPGRVVDTGNINGDVNGYTLLGGELAGVYGPFSLQGEYIAANVDRDRGGDPGFNGWYAFGSWFLTGESRSYRADRGTFDVIQPNSPFNLKSGGPGAWELAIRLSQLDLSDKNVEGGVIRDLTVGLNWYPNAYVRVMANYINVLDLDGGANDDQDLSAFQLRTQVTY